MTRRREHEGSKHIKLPAVVGARKGLKHPRRHRFFFFTHVLITRWSPKSLTQLWLLVWPACWSVTVSPLLLQMETDFPPATCSRGPFPLPAAGQSIPPKPLIKQLEPDQQPNKNVLLDTGPEQSETHDYDPIGTWRKYGPGG